MINSVPDMQSVFESLPESHTTVSGLDTKDKPPDPGKPPDSACQPCHSSAVSLAIPCRPTPTDGQYHRSASSLYVSSVSSMTTSIKSDNSSLMLPMCRICHMPEENGKLLNSPCRCAGSLKYVHNSCLVKWIEISSRKRKNRPPRCEICRYHYLRHKRFKFRHLRLPRISRCDKILHSIFFVTVAMMIACAIATVMCFLSDRGRATQNAQNPEARTKLTTEEIVTLTCGVMFFVAFFVAMSVQIKARRTIYQILVRCVSHNMIWTIEQYDKRRDLDYRGPPVAV